MKLEETDIRLQVLTVTECNALQIAADIAYATTTVKSPHEASAEALRDRLWTLRPCSLNLTRREAKLIYHGLRGLSIVVDLLEDHDLAAAVEEALTLFDSLQLDDD